ncbi:MAG: class I SAM-dependent methyltransferase [Planctomycetota bacterium]
MLTRLFNLLCRCSPRCKRWLWRRWYEFLASRYKTQRWSFMNYGYASTTDTSTTDAPAHGRAGPRLDAVDEPDRYCIQLYHHVASAIDLNGKTVLEVGCGRGGGASYVKRYLGPRTVTGVDLSPTAIELCRHTHQVEGLSFETGDAEELPFEAASFDVVLNVESSHCYGNFARFLEQVARVLRPGGHFLFADLRPRQQLQEMREALKQSDLFVVSETDIAANVVRALELDDSRKRNQIQEFIGKRWRKTFARFAGVQGSPIYEEFKNGDEAYYSFVLRRPED